MWTLSFPSTFSASMQQTLLSGSSWGVQQVYLEPRKRSDCKMCAQVTRNDNAQSETVQRRKIFLPCTLTGGRLSIGWLVFQVFKKQVSKVCSQAFQVSYRSWIFLSNTQESFAQPTAPCPNLSICRDNWDKTDKWPKNFASREELRQLPDWSQLWIPSDLSWKKQVSGRSEPQHQFPEQELFAPLRNSQEFLSVYWERANNENNPAHSFPREVRYNLFCKWVIQPIHRIIPS